MKNKLKIILGYIFVFLIPFFMLIIVFNFRPYKQDVIPKLSSANEKKGYIVTQLFQSKVKKKFDYVGVITPKDDNIKKITISKAGKDVTIKRKTGYIFESGITIYSVDGEDKSFDFNGMILSIINNDDELTFELLDYSKQFISVKINIDKLDKISSVEKIIISKDFQEFECTILSIDPNVVNNFITIFLNSEYVGFIDEKVEISFVEFEKDGYMTIKDFVIFENKKYFIIIMENDIYKKVEIQAGIESGDDIELISSILYDGIKIYQEYNRTN